MSEHQQQAIVPSSNTGSKEPDKSFGVTSDGTAISSTFEAELAGVVVSNYELSYNPTFLLSPTLVVVAANKAARNMSCLRGSVSIINSKLSFHDLQMEGQLLSKFLTFSSSAFVSQGLKRQMLFENDRLRVMLMDVTRLSQRSMFLVQLRDRASEEGFQIEALMDRDLTHSEARVALSLFNGRTTAEHAVTCGITISTARTHLQRAMSKLGVSRQAQLVASLAQMFST